jgi:hypothetical protein
MCVLYHSMNTKSVKYVYDLSTDNFYTYMYLLDSARIANLLGRKIIIALFTCSLVKEGIEAVIHGFEKCSSVSHTLICHIIYLL